MSTLLSGPVAPSSTLVLSAPTAAPSGDAFHRRPVPGSSRKIDYVTSFVPPADRKVLGELALARLNDLLQLSRGWDGFRARPVTDAAAVTAIKTLFAVANDHSLAPQIVPLVDGGVQLEWHAGGFSIEIEVDGSGDAHYLAVNAEGEIVVDEEATTSRTIDLPELTGVLLERLSGLVRRAS